MNRMKKWLAREDGSAAAAAVFAMAAAALIAGLVATGASTIQSTGAARSLNATSSAVDARFGLWADQMDAGDTAEVDSICYSNAATCVSISTVKTIGDVSVVTLQAVRGEKTSTRTRAYKALGDSVMTGFDNGAPVWSR